MIINLVCNSKYFSHLNVFTRNFICAIIIGFPTLGNGQHLEFEKTNSEITRVFQFTMPEKENKYILQIRGEKKIIKNFTLSYNSKVLDTKSCHLRGSSTLNFQRKSFAVSLKQPLELDGRSLNKFSLTNLVMDKNYWRNRFSFIVLHHLGIFPLYNSYAEIKINKASQGVYLVQEKPEEYASSFLHSPLIARRLPNNSFRIYFSSGKKGNEIMKYLKKFQKLPNKYSGKQLYDSLNQLIEMQNYFTWLAFNYLVMNGDYTDEIFLYYDDRNSKFNIIPWDYDDVFYPEPHEGWEMRNSILKNELLYSSEAQFDRIIDGDQYLYDQYKIIFRRVLDQLTPSYLERVFIQIEQELYPYYTNKEVIEQSKYDLYGLTNLDKLHTDLDNHFNFLSDRLRNIQKEIKSDEIH